jgi:hypothetical protein
MRQQENLQLCEDPVEISVGIEELMSKLGTVIVQRLVCPYAGTQTDFQIGFYNLASHRGQNILHLHTCRPVICLRRKIKTDEEVEYGHPCVFCKRIGDFRSTYIPGQYITPILIGPCKKYGSN